MSQLTIEGLEELMDDLEAVAELPDSVASEMLNKQADVVVKAQKSRISSIGLVDTGKLMRSVRKSDSIKKTGSSRSIEVYPDGTRPNGVRNAEVGFIHEYGAAKKNIPAKKWMQQANEACAEKTTEAAREVYNKFLESKNL